MTVASRGLMSGALRETTTSAEFSTLKNPDDDLARESAFYDQAMAAVVIGRKKLDDLGSALARVSVVHSQLHTYIFEE